MFLTSSAQNRLNPADLSIYLSNSVKRMDSHGTRHIKKGRSTAAAGWVLYPLRVGHGHANVRRVRKLPFLEEGSASALENLSNGKSDAPFREDAT
jgi:hypothetical protein